MGFFGQYTNDPFYRKEVDQIYEIPLTALEAFYGTQKEIIVDAGISQRRYSIQIPPGVGPNTRLSLVLNELGERGIQFRVKII